MKLLKRVFFVAIVLQWTQNYKVAAQFYKGCSDNLGSNREYSVDQSKLPFSCIHLCIKERYSYAAAQNGSRCFCCRSVQTWTNSSRCNIRCPSNNNLYCGSVICKSVYTTDLPTVASVIMPFKFKSIPTDTHFKLEATASINHIKNESIDLQSIEGMNKSLDQVYITWRQNGIVQGYSNHSLVGNTVNIDKSINLPKPGLFRLCVKIENLVSEKTECGILESLQPVSDIRLIDVEPKRNILLNKQNTSLFKVDEQVNIKVALTNGSKTRFKVSFGDGTVPFSLSSNKDPYFLGFTCLTTWHRYFSCGNYTIQVVGINAVSNASLSVPIRVEQTLMFATLTTVTGLPGQEVNLQVIVNGRFCKASYNWTIESKHIITEEPYLKYIFNETKSYIVSVKVSNDINSIVARSTVHIQTQLTPSNVTLIIEGNRNHSKYTVRKINQDITFGATMEPYVKNIKLFWYFNGQKKSSSAALHKYTKYEQEAFNEPGSYSVYVIAESSVGSVKSNVVQLFIEEPVYQVDLEHKGVIIVKQNIIFTAVVNNDRKINNFKVHWDFGDGNTLKTLNTYANHTYNKINLYNVQVMVYNNVSGWNSSTSIYVTKLPSCQPPSVEIIGRKFMKSFRHEQLYLESQVSLDCKWPQVALVYEWKVIPLSNENIKSNISAVMSSETVLIIPPYTLNYGGYNIILKVRINATVLFTEKKVDVTVEEDDLIATIKGGSMRVVGYQSEEEIVLDGTMSTDPDFPKDNHQLKFKWTCHLLHDNTSSCFVSKVKTTSPLLKVPAKKFLPGKEAFIITLTVIKPGKKNNRSSTWQELRIVNASPHLLALHCPQCDKGTVNYNDELVLHGDCSTCPWNTNKNVTFEWQLYLVKNNPNPDMKPDKCKPGRIVMQSIKSNRGAPSAKNITNILPTSKQMSSYPTTHVIIPTGGTKPPIVQERGRIEKGSVCTTPIFKSTEPPTKCRAILNLGNRKIFTCPTLEPTKFHGTLPEGHGSVSPGIGSGRTSNPTPSGSPVTNPTKPTTQPTTAGTKPGKPVKPTGQSGILFDPKYRVPDASTQHSILGIDRTEFLMTASWTKTGLNNRNFVLKKGNLVSGEMYMLALIVNRPDKTAPELRRGMASVFFTVNKNPEIAKCTLFPGSGIEIETLFKLSCTLKEGKNNDLGRYHVTYKIQGEQQEVLIYSGKKTKPTFTLPAGLPSHGYNVTVFVSAFNKKGTAVEVCPLTLKVKPRVINNSLITDEEYLLNKTRDNYMKTLIKLGEEQQVKQLVKVLAKALNRLGPVKSTTSKFYLRREARLELLKVVRQWVILDKISAVQTAEVLDVITRVPSEINRAGFETVTQLLSKVEREFTKEESLKPSQLNTDIIILMTRIVSNLISVSYSLKRFDIMKHKEIQCQVVKAIQTALKHKLQKTVLGEGEFRIVQPMLSAVASQSVLISQSRWALQNVSFLLPSSMKDHIHVDSQTYTAACVGTTMIVYEENPFPWSESNKLFETKASSLALSSCSGRPIPIHDLKEEVEINLPWKHQKANSPVHEYTIKWKSLNIHSITRDNSVENHSLQLVIQILSTLDDGMVLRVVVFLNDKEEDIEQSSISRSIGRGNVTFMLTSKDLKNASGVIGVGVVMEDVALNRIKKVFNATPAKYSVSSKWIGCYYWDETEEIWSTWGCFSTEQTTDAFINCRCNHLTMFVGKAFWTPNPMSFKDLSDISRLENNLIPLVLVLCLVAVYICLMIYFHKLDTIDDQKGGVVFLAGMPSRRSYRYKITVETGHWFGSGTTATVVMRMFGEVNTSDPIELVAKEKPLFERGSKDVFIFDSSSDLSPVWKIHIWHYNDGSSPSWYLNRVIIQDMASNDKWYFDAFRWLAVDEEDGKVDVELMPLGTKNNVIKRHYHHVSQYVLDYHLWLSVLGRPSSSNFNHKQRLTCCLSLVLTFLCVNAAWFRTKSLKRGPFEILGLMDITWETVVYGILCSLIAIPINLLWILMFRYSKRDNSFRAKIAPLPYDDPITETSCIVNGIDYNEDSISILDQTIETFLYLKALGQKIKPYSSYWDDKSSLDSVFENFEGKSLSFCSGSELQTVILAKLSPNPVRYDESLLLRSSSQVTTLESTKGCFLHHRCAHIAWVGCVLTMIITSFFTVSYGLSFGRQKCLIWVQSLCFSLIESLFISQPLMVLAIPIYAMCSKWASRSKSKVAPFREDNEDRAEDRGLAKKNDNYLNMSLKGALEARRRQRYLKFLKPLSKTVLADASEKKHVRNVVFDYTRDFLTVIVLLLLLGVLVSGMYCRAALTIKDTIQKTIIKHSFNDELSGRGRLDQWWKYNQKNLIDLLYWRPDEWALNKNQTAQVFFKGTSSVLVGRPRIRQYKTTKHKLCNNVSISGENETWTRKCWTRCITEEGQWSSVELSRTKSNAEEELQQLTRTGWVSICTNHIAIEFVLYAPSLNIFSAVTWEVRGQSSGLSYTNIRVSTIKDVTSDTAMDIILKVCKVLFVLVFIFCLHSEIVCFVRIKLKYFKSIWKFIKVCCLVLSSLSIVAYMYWTVAVYTLVREVLSEGRDDVVTAGLIVHRRQEMLISLYAITIFVIALEVVHLLRVFKFVQRFCGILWTSFGSVCSLMVLLVLAIVMLSHFGYLVFGRHQKEFKSFSTAFIHISGLLRRKGIDNLQNDSDMLSFSILHLFSCIAMLLVVLRGLSMAILNWSVRSTKRKHLPTHLLVNYLSNLWYTFNRKKIEEESDDEEDDFEDEVEDKQIIPVEYACDEVEFQMEELLFKMNNLVGESGLADLRLSSSSDLLLSSDEYEDDVEYLYRQGNSLQLMVAELGSGYESDRSFYSIATGSVSQEGLTDLELQRRISKDSSVITSEMNAYDLKEINRKHFEMNVDLHNQVPQYQPSKDPNVNPKVLYRTKSFLSQTNESQEQHPAERKTESDALQSPSATYVENRRASLTKTKEKHRLLTRKPKLRQGQISLDDIPKDICLASSSSVYPEGSTSSEDDKLWAKGKTSTSTASPKKPGYIKTLLSKGSISPMNDGDDRPTTMDVTGLNRSSSSYGSNDRHYDGYRSTCFDENSQRPSALFIDRRYSADVPLSPSEPGFSNTGYFEDNEYDNESTFSDDVVPLPGLVDDTSMHINISTNINSTNYTS